MWDVLWCKLEGLLWSSVWGVVLCCDGELLRVVVDGGGCGVINNVGSWMVWVCLKCDDDCDSDFYGCGGGCVGRGRIVVGFGRGVIMLW